MKKKNKIVLAIVTLIIVTLIGCNREEFVEKIPMSEIPDMAFLNYLLMNFDTNRDGFISMKEANSIQEIDLREVGVASLKGIEYFTSLVKLIVGEVISRDATVDLSNNLMLEVLEVNYFDLSHFDISKNINLKELSCSTLSKTLDLSNNIALEKLVFFRSHLLETLDLSNHKRLRILSFTGTRLSVSSLNLNDYKYLEELYCVGTTVITDLSISNIPLRILACSNIQNLNLSNLPLKDLNCFNIRNLNISNLLDLESITLNHTSVPGDYLDLTNHIKLKNLVCGAGCNFRVDISKCTALEELVWMNISQPIDISNNKALRFLLYRSENDVDISNNTALETLDYTSESFSQTGKLLSIHNNTLLKNVRIVSSEGEKYDFSNNPLIENLNIQGQRNGTNREYTNEINIDNCRNLIELSIADCFLYTLDVRNKVKLKEVNISGCDSLSTINASNLQNLERFQVWNGQNANSVDADFSNCRNLKELQISPKEKSLNIRGCTSLNGWTSYPR